MRVNFIKCGLAALAVAVVLGIGRDGIAQGGAGAAPDVTRPDYRISARIDYELMALRSTAQIAVPVAPGDALNDVVFFIYANAAGVGGSDGTGKHIVVDRVTLDGEPVTFKMTGAVLRVALPQPRNRPFVMQIESRGVVPRSPAGSGGILDMLGGMSGDLSGMLGGLGGGNEAPQKPQNTDYGLYTYGNGILSLGSFWYPTLAVRQAGRWVDEQPQGLGDVEYSDISDFAVALEVPRNVTVAATGEGRQSEPGRWNFTARGVRDFAVLMSDGFQVHAKTVTVGGKPVVVQSYTLKNDMARADQAIDIAGNALQIYARRFGAYPYSNFKVVEGPIRGGAGGMEFSGLTSIASMLYQDLGKQLGALANTLGAGNLDKLMGDLQEDGGEAAKGGAGAAKAGTDNPATDMLNGILGQQQGIFESLFETTVAHETAHQWWAIGVGSDSQRAPFVDESLTNYSAMVYFEDRYGHERAQQMIDLHLKTTYSMGRMLGSGDAPANLRTSAYRNNMQYGAVIYGKGALYYDTVRRAMGDQAFFAALRDYYATYEGRLAGPGALVGIMQAKAPAAHVPDLYRRWIEQAHGDEDITGGKAMGLDDLLGGLLGGLTADQ